MPSPKILAVGIASSLLVAFFLLQYFRKNDTKRKPTEPESTAERKTDGIKPKPENHQAKVKQGDRHEAEAQHVSTLFSVSAATPSVQPNLVEAGSVLNTTPPTNDAQGPVVNAHQSDTPANITTGELLMNMVSIEEVEALAVPSVPVDVVAYVRLVEECEPFLVAKNQRDYFQKLEHEYENIARALFECKARGTEEYVTYALRIIGGITRFWFVTGRQQEGYNTAKHFLDSYPRFVSECNETTAKFFRSIGFMAHACGSFDEAEEHFSTAVSYYSTIGNATASATVANQIGTCMRERGEYNRAEALHNSALEIYTEEHNDWGIALAKNNLGVVAREKGEFDRANQLFHESLAIRQTIGDEIGVASSLGNLGALSYAQLRYADAASLHEQCLAIRRSLHDHWGVCGALVNRALVLIELNDIATASASLAEAVKLFAKIQDQLGICECLEAYACLYGHQKNYQKATVLFSASQELRAKIHAYTPLSRRGHHDKYLTECSLLIEKQKYDELVRQGTYMSAKAAVEFATQD